MGSLRGQLANASDTNSTPAACATIGGHAT
jgi:hypothetical protein